MYKKLNSDGEAIENQVFNVRIPEALNIRFDEFTVAENNYILSCTAQRGAGNGRSSQIVINRQSKKVVSDFNDDGFLIGSRYNDHIIDNRYIIFSPTPRPFDQPFELCIFDDKTSEIHILSFESLKDAYIVNTAVDYNGDVLFQIQDDIQSEDTRSLVLFKDITSLI